MAIVSSASKSVSRFKLVKRRRDFLASLVRPLRTSHPRKLELASCFETFWKGAANKWRALGNYDLQGDSGAR